MLAVSKIDYLEDLMKIFPLYAVCPYRSAFKVFVLSNCTFIILVFLADSLQSYIIYFIFLSNL